MDTGQAEHAPTSAKRSSRLQRLARSRPFDLHALSAFRKNVNHRNVAADFNPTLNGLRGLAVLLVFSHHVFLNGFQEGFLIDLSSMPWLYWLLDHGQYGVEIFFMISGYLITASLIRHDSAGRFLIDRCIRIYPAFLALHIPIFILGPLVGYKFLADVTLAQWFEHFVSNALFLPGLLDLPRAQPVAWTLSYEAAFYVMAALAFLLVRRGGAYSATLIVVPAVIGLTWLYPRAIFFSVGVLVYLCGSRISAGLGRWHFPFLWLVVFLVFWDFPEQPGSARAVGWIMEPTLIGGVVAVLAGLLAFTSLVSERGGLSRLLRTQHFQFLGLISYSFYLWHTAVFFALKPIIGQLVALGWLGNPSAILAFTIVGFIGSVAVSVVSYELFERRAGRFLKRKVASWRPLAQAPESA